MTATGTEPTTSTLDIDAFLERCRYRGPAIGWDDIVGHEPAKRELRIVAEQYRRQGVAERLGLTLVKGILLMGPPGCGKSLLARALASVAERPVYAIPSAEADATLIRRIYEAVAQTPCVLVWDEADVLLQARHRAPPAERRTVAAWCSAVDGVDPKAGPISLCLTADREWGLDPSALRSGRLTTKVVMELPDLAERRALWERYTTGLPVDGVISLDLAAERSAGLSGADIQATVLAALGLGLVDGIEALRQDLLDEALMRGGHVREHEHPSTSELDHRAIHEAGHALHAALTWGPDAVATVTLHPTAGSDGRTILADRLRDQATLTIDELRNLACWAYSGLAAEQLVFGADRVSAGSGDDIRRATQILLRLAADLGGSEVVGPLDVSVLEAGGDSDRGRIMREALFHELWHDANDAFDLAFDLLEQRTDAIRRFADTLLAAPGHTLSGNDLRVALDSTAIAAAQG